MDISCNEIDISYRIKDSVSESAMHPFQIADSPRLSPKTGKAKWVFWLGSQKNRRFQFVFKVKEVG